MIARGSGGHLARRFFASLSPRQPVPADEAWARDALRERELARWAQLSPQDRRHSIGVARSVAERDEPWIVRAALLHDIGKAEARIGTLARVAATVIDATGRRAPGRLGEYQDYPERGAAFLAAGGVEPQVVAWAHEHHLPTSAWTIPHASGQALAAADNLF